MHAGEDGSVEDPRDDALASAPSAGDGFYQMERLDRGLVVVPQREGNYVGFRLFGTEQAAPPSFVLLRDGEAIATLEETTDFVDVAGKPDSRYSVRARRGEEFDQDSEESTPWPQSYLSVPLSPPEGAYSANDASAGDLDGDCAFLAYWDGEDDRELVDGVRIQTVEGRELLSCEPCASNNGTKSTPTLVADLLGDYREEVLWREQDNRSLRLYTSTAPAARRLHTLMHDPQYRVQVSFQNARITSLHIQASRWRRVRCRRLICTCADSTRAVGSLEDNQSAFGGAALPTRRRMAKLSSRWQRRCRIAMVDIRCPDGPRVLYIRRLNRT